tara:strand:+ start:242 stop:505 length:264 start_codon:yes stop_codon:yes gene_type:complete
MSNHLGDTNKMVDTPRTDENTFRAYTSPDNSSRSCVSASFARQLERELNAANDRIKRLEEAGDTLSETQTYDLIQNINWRKAKEAKL